jgi:hypothetical protein
MLFWRILMPAEIGDNGGPALDPLPALKTDVDDLVSEADSLVAITTEEQAEAVKDLLKRAKASVKAADDTRTAEKEPHLLAGRNVDERFKPVITAAKAAQATVQAILTPWNVGQERIRKALAQKLRDEAAATLAAAQQAHKSIALPSPALSRDVQEGELYSVRSCIGFDNLQTRIDADLANEQAAKQTAQANRLDKVAKGLRTSWDAKVEFPLIFGKWAWENCHDEYMGFLTGLAERQIRIAKRDLPGVRAIERKSA